MEKIILYIGLIIGIVYIIKIKLELRSIEKQMKSWRGEYINIRTGALGNDVERLVKEINCLYDANQEVEAKNKRIEDELKRSISNISHDLRTPLTSINGYVQLLKNGKTEEEREECIEVIERRTKSLQSLVTEFYELSRLQSNDYIFNLKSINIKIILIDNVAIYYNEFINRGIEPVIEIDDEIEDIISDEVAVNRIFSNLIGNMIKHGQDNIKIILKEEKEYISTRFINKAESLSEEEVKKIFDRFYIKDKSRTNRNTGLGLSITKSFVERLGHKILAKKIGNNLEIEIKWNKLKK